MLAARLDALSSGRAAHRSSTPSVVGQTFWEGSLGQLADERGHRPAGGHRLARRRRTSIAPTAGSRLAGEREYAFKHVLIRDVAYSTLPKAVRARKHAEVGRVHRGARRRPRRGRRRHGGRALRPRRGPGRGRRPARRRARRHHPRARSSALEDRRRRSPPRSTPTWRPSATTRWPSSLRRGCDAATRARDRREARRRRAPPRPRRPRRRALGEVPRLPPRRGGPRARRRPAPQDRRRRSGTRATARARSSTTSAASTC